MILLDTHALLFWIRNSKNLIQEALNAINKTARMGILLLENKYAMFSENSDVLKMENNGA